MMRDYTMVKINNMGEIKYRIKEYEEYVHEYNRSESGGIMMEVEGTRKVYHPEINYGKWYDGWNYLTEYPCYSEAEAFQKIENHKKRMSIELDNKVRYINVD